MLTEETLPKPPQKRARPSDGLFRSLGRSHAFEPLHVEGRLPKDLEGTLYRNGPGLFQGVDGSALHPFDAVGAVSAVRFHEGKAEGAARVLSPPDYVRERAAGSPLYGGYDYYAPGLRRFGGKMRNNANTHIVPFRDTLLALWEGGRPLAVSPETLETLGTLNLGGVIGHAFSAHPHYVEARKATYNFGLRNALDGMRLRTWLDLFELPDHGPVKKLGEVTLKRPYLVHDFIATDKHLVFFLGPVIFDILSAATTRRHISSCLTYRPELPAEILVVDIDDPTRQVSFDVEPFHIFHFANAYTVSEEIVVNFVRFPNADSLHALASVANGGDGRGYEGQLYTATIDPRRKRATFTKITDRYCEFPRVHPAREANRARYVYTSAYARNDEAKTRALHGTICRTDLESGAETCFTFEDDEQVSEPVFAARTGHTAEDDGYVLTLVSRAAQKRSYVAVLDARKLAEGPLARVFFDQQIPMTFHGSFVPTRSL